jgi:hypothetical protein
MPLWKYEAGSKKFKITFVWKHEYSVVINGCPEARTKASFSVMT